MQTGYGIGIVYFHNRIVSFLADFKHHAIHDLITNIFIHLIKVVSQEVPKGKSIYSTYGEGIPTSTERTFYDRTGSLTKVNEAQPKLFSKWSRSLDSIPPSRASLEQHVKRAVF